MPRDMKPRIDGCGTGVEGLAAGGGGKRRPRLIVGRVSTAGLGVEGAPNPGRISRMWNVETPSGSKPRVLGLVSQT
jgi:hypothetical protein